MRFRRGVAGQVIDSREVVIQYCSMTAIPVSKRWTITLPPEIRKGLGLEGTDHPMMLLELRDGGVFMQPAAAMPVRDIPLKQLREWIREDEKDADRFWKSASSTKTGGRKKDASSK
jgi:bifunctional DNA-binding transcriptional regulator/antitoxin component of YhaV-PrlF toxin-antitoxin module